MTMKLQIKCANHNCHFYKMALTILLLIATGVAVGCDKTGPADARLVGLWEIIPGTSKLVLNADGTFSQVMGDPLLAGGLDTSGKWGVKDGQLNLVDGKTKMTMKWNYELLGEGDQLKLTWDPGNTIFQNMSKTPIIYRKHSNS